jgi:hypothetical protein
VLSSGGHFLVHRAENGRHAISASRARALARHAESAWRVEIGRWGWPAPLDDGDGPLDVYVYRIDNAGQVTSDGFGGPASAWMAVHPEYVNPVTVAHELLHMSQYAIDADNHGQVLDEGLGNWAGHAVTNNAFPPDWAEIDPIRPFGCVGWTSCVFGKWAFFQFIAERYGHRALVDAYRRAANMEGDPERFAVPAIDAALQARGASIGEATTAYAAAVTTVDFDLGALRGFRPQTAAEPRLGCRAEFARGVPVDHLAARWIEFESLCFRDATLNVSVTWPQSLARVRPALGTSAPVEGLPVSRRDGRMTATVPAGAISGRFLLGLANPSLDADDQRFRVAIQSVARRFARVRVLRPLRAADGLPRRVSVRLRSSRRFWLGAGFFRNGMEAEQVGLARARRGTSTLEVPVPDGLRAGRYRVSLRGGAIVEGPVSGRVRVPARR